MADELEELIERVLGRLGLELVDFERAGGRARPILRLRIDRLDSEGGGITVADCAAASRALEAELDEVEELISSYILEVSSPGVERPLRKRADFERFAGREIAMRGFKPLVGGSRRVEGTLLGIEGRNGEERVLLRLVGDSEVKIPRSDIARARLLFDWNEVGQRGEQKGSARKKQRKKSQVSGSRQLKHGRGTEHEKR